MNPPGKRRNRFAEEIITLHKKMNCHESINDFIFIGMMN